MSGTAHRGVIWDFENTLVERVRSDLEIAGYEFARRGVELTRLHPVALAEAQAWYQAASPGWRTLEQECDGYVELLNRALRSSGVHVTIRRQEVGERVNAGFGAYQIIAGIEDVLRAVERTGTRQAVVSNWLPSLPNVLRSLGLSAFFALVVASSLEGVQKPDPQLLARALDRLRIRPGEAIVVGDDPARDLIPAASLGCRPVHFDPLGKHPQAIQSCTKLTEVLLTQLMQ